MRKLKKDSTNTIKPKVKTDKIIWSKIDFRIADPETSKITSSYSAWFRKIHAHDKKRIQGELQRALNQKEKGLNIEYRVQHPQKGRRWINAKGEIFYDKQKKPLRMIGIALDITERRNMEERLKESKEKYALLFFNMTNGFAYHKVILNKAKNPVDYIFLEVNEAFENLTGLNRGSVIGKKVSEVLPGIKSDPADWIGRYGKVALTGKPTRFERYSQRLDRWYSIVAYSPRKGFFATVFEDITVQKQAEEKLIRERSLLESVMQTTDVMLVYLDNQFNFVWVNQAYAETCRMTPEEVVGKNHFALYPDPENEAIFRKVRDTGLGVFFRDKPFVFPDQPDRGVTYWNWSLTPVKNPEGKVTGLVFSLRETTKYRQAEAALRESEKRLRLAQVSAGAGIWDWDLPAGTLEWSDELYHLFGLESGKNRATFELWASVLHPDDRQSAENRIEWAIESGKPLDNEYRIVLPSGEVRWINAFGNTTYDDSGKARRMSGICIDITERKQVESLLLTKSKEQQVILDSTPAMIFFKDKENRFLHVNKAFEEIMGMPRESLEGKSMFDLFPREQAEAFWKDDLEVINNRSAKRGIIEPIETSRGTRIVQTDKIPYIDEKGQVKGIIGFAIDITERIKLEDDLKRYNEELEERVRMRAEEVVIERQRLYSVLETLPVYVILLDKDYRVPFANKIFRERFGDAKGRRCYEFLFNKNEPCEGCETFKVLKTNAPHRWEWLGPDGRNYDIYDYAFVEADGSTLILEMGIDITEQKRAQESLLQASQYARSLIEASLDPLVTISNKGKITDINEATIKATGLSREELIDTDFSTYFTEPHKAKEGYEKAFSQGFVINYPLTLRHKDGSLMNVQYNATVYRDKSGNVQGIFAAARDVTELKHAEAALQAERKRLFDVLETLPVMICLLTPDYHVSFANKAFREKFGESQGRRCYEYCFKRKKPCEFCESYSVLKTGKPHKWELTGLDGSVMEAYDFPFTDADGSPLILEMDIDITERKRAVEMLKQLNQTLEQRVIERTAALKQIENDLNRAQVVARTGSWRLDVTKNELTWSEENHRIFGIEKGEYMTYETFLSAVHPDDRAYVDQKWRAALRGEPYDIEHRILINGKVKWVRELAEIELDEHGNLIGGFGTTQDITERKDIEEKIEKISRFPVENPSPVMRLNQDCEIIFANRASAPILNEWNTSPGGYPPDDFCAIISKAFSKDMIREIEVEAAGKVFNVSLVPITRQGYINLYGVDITERKRAEEALEELNRLLEQKIIQGTRELVAMQIDLERARRLSDIGTLAATVAHELRNPLAAISMATYNIRRKVKTHDIDRQIANIEKKIAESDQIINNLLFYSRLKPPHYERLKIIDIIQESIELIDDKGTKDLSIIKDIDTLKDVYIEGDPIQIKEVFNNILNNAYDAADSNSPHIKITSRIDHEYVCIIIEDNGHGIEKEILEKVFDPFFTTKSKGTGLGLSVCRQIVEFHKGSISIESEQGKRTAVTVRLPREK